LAENCGKAAAREIFTANSTKSIEVQPTVEEKPLFFRAGRLIMDTYEFAVGFLSLGGEVKFGNAG
jgi:hypothetical protein